MARYRLQLILTQEIPDRLLMDIAYHWQANDNRRVSVPVSMQPLRPATAGRTADRMEPASSKGPVLTIVTSHMRACIARLAGRCRGATGEWCVSLPTLVAFSC